MSRKQSAKIREQRRYRTVDLPFYRAEIAPFLPPSVLDFHAHTWSVRDWKIRPWKSGARGGKYMVTDEYYPPATLVADGRRCFPDRSYHAVCFGYPTPATNWERDTAFVAAAARRYRCLFPLVLAGRDLGVSRARYEQVLAEGRFFGFKVVLNWFGDDYGNKRIEDMIGPVEMRVADERNLIVLLHVPRRGRLADPVVQRGVERLSKQYPGAQIVLAHCGRCYLPAEMRCILGFLRRLTNVSLDTAMVMDPMVLWMAMDALGSERLLYATDFPVAAMRGCRVRVMDHWVDVVLEGYPKSAYRIAGDNIRATFMAWEIVLAIREAAAQAGLSARERDGIFWDNGIRLLRRVERGRRVRSHGGEKA